LDYILLFEHIITILSQGILTFTYISPFMFDFFAILVFLLGLLVSFVVGGNNSVPSVAILISTRVIKTRYSILIASISMFLGASLGSFSMQKFAERAIRGPLYILEMVFFSTLLISLISFLILSKRGIPTSLSQMIYPSLTIIALISDGVLVINLHTLLLVISSWIFSPIISILLTISLYFLIRRYIDRIENSLIKVIKFYRLIILASCSFIVFVLGANTIGLLVSLGLVSFPHNIVELTYAVGASLGTFTLSKRAAIKVGFKITKLGYTSSSSVMLGSFLTSEVFTLMGIPISLTQITMGGIIGLSLLNMSNKSTSSNVRNVIKNWTMAPLLCMMGSLVAFESTSALVFLHAL